MKKKRERKKEKIPLLRIQMAALYLPVSLEEKTSAAQIREDWEETAKETRN